MLLDLVVPFYNPKPGWEERLVRRFNQLIAEHFEGNPDAVHVIIVNDGSIANFGAKELLFLEQYIPQLKVISYTENKGKGHALRMGVTATRTDYCIYSDNDFPFGIAAIREMYDALQHGADIVTGRRTQGNYFKHLPLKRRIASKGLAFINKYLLGLPVTDTQAGIKGFNQQGKAIFLKTTTERFLFDLEFILIACRIEDICIQEIDVNIVAGTKMTNFSRKILQQEFRNLISIILRMKYKKRSGKSAR